MMTKLLTGTISLGIDWQQICKVTIKSPMLNKISAFLTKKENKTKIKLFGCEV